MTILLDTHVFLWTLTDDARLSQKARDLIGTADIVYVSSVSIWEIAIKKRLGKIQVDLDLLIKGIEQQEFVELFFKAKHAIKTSEVMSHHHDPFDRALVAQALSESLRLITADKTLQAYSDLIEVI